MSKNSILVLALLSTLSLTSLEAGRKGDKRERTTHQNSKHSTQKYIGKKSRKSRPNKSFTKHWAPVRKDDTYRLLAAKSEQYDPVTVSLETASLMVLLGTSSNE